MKNDLSVKNGITIPEHELHISTSRSGGAGGQHVNKTETRVTLRWNVHASQAVNDAQKQRIAEKLQHQLTTDGDIVVHASAGRSQAQNKKAALAQLATIIRQALHVPKKRMKTKISKATKEARLRQKSQRSKIKKLRSSRGYQE